MQLAGLLANPLLSGGDVLQPSPIMHSPRKRKSSTSDVAARKPGQTTTDIGEQRAPRLPHERDESSDSQTEGVREIIKQAAQDLKQGMQDTDRGPPMDEVYGRTLRPHDAAAAGGPSPRRKPK